MNHCISPLIQSARLSYESRLGAYYRSLPPRCSDRRSDVLDLAFGDLYEMPRPDLVRVLQDGVVPRQPDWFAEDRGSTGVRHCIARSLSEEFGADIEPGDIALTNGAFAGLMVCLRTVCAPGTKVVYLTPSGLYYDTMIRSVGAVPRAVPTWDGTWGLDLDGIADALTDDTSAIIVNTPNNPTGAVYGERDLAGLGALLSEASHQQGRPVYLISDESYRSVVFDGVHYVSPTVHYPYSFLVYSYTTASLAPTEEIGYVAVGPTMPHRSDVRDAVAISQLMTGWTYPDNSLQDTLHNVEALKLDVSVVQWRHDLVVSALETLGYQVQRSKGTFYVFVRAPAGDDWAFAETMAQRGVLVMPGALTGSRGWFRISLTAPDPVLVAALDRFDSVKPDDYGRLLSDLELAGSRAMAHA